MRTSERPPTVAVVTAAMFRVRNIVLLLAGFLLPKLIGAGFVAAAFIGLVLFVAGIGVSAGDPRFLAQVQERRKPLLASAGDRPGLASAAAPPQLTGKFRASFDRVRQLSESLETAVRGLPSGPLTETIAEFLPQLSDVVPEVGKLLSQAQKAEAEASSGARAALEKEAQEVEARLVGITDTEVRSKLETALARKREALGHIASAGSALARIEAQVEAIASGLQEARARLAALAADTESLDASPARLAVEGVSRDVKFLAQAVQETERLLIAPKEDQQWDSGRESDRSSQRT